MKKILIGLCLVSAVSFVHAQDNYAAGQVPMAVKESFHKDYPDAKMAHWKYANKQWRADFQEGDKQLAMAACYSRRGHHIDSRIPVSRDAIPASVMTKLNDKYPGNDAYAYRFTRIERPRKSDLYQVRMKEQGTTYKTLYMDKKGHEKDYASR